MFFLSSLSARLSRQWQRFSADWHVLLEKPVPPKKLSFMLHQTSLPSFGFYFMLTLATTIATLGLLSNSAATIIGAMIVAPLMGPITSLAYGIVSADYELWSRSMLTTLTGMVAVVAISVVAAHAIGVRVLGSEILARTNPTLLDLGVAIAAGGAGGFALTRKSIGNALAGVAIAVALVPPLCVTGIGIGLGSDIALGVGLSPSDVDIRIGSFLLFATNLVGIVVGAGMVFLLQAYGSFRQAIGGLAASVLALALVSYPLGFSFNRLLIRNQVYRSLTDVQRQQPELFNEVSSYSWNVRFLNDTVFVEIDLMAPAEAFDRVQLGVIKDEIDRSVDVPVLCKFRLIPIAVVDFGEVPAQSGEQ